MKIQIQITFSVQRYKSMNMQIRRRAVWRAFDAHYRRCRRTRYCSDRANRVLPDEDSEILNICAWIPYIDCGWELPSQKYVPSQKQPYPRQRLNTMSSLPTMISGVFSQRPRFTALRNAIDTSTKESCRVGEKNSDTDSWVSLFYGNATGYWINRNKSPLLELVSAHRLESESYPLSITLL